MNLAALLGKGLWQHRRIAVAVAAGAAVGTAVLTGALFVGDSVRHSLERGTELRLGKARWLTVSGDRTFRSALAPELGEDLGVPAASAFLLRGVASAREGAAGAGGVQVVGADGSFWSMAPEAPDRPGPKAGGAWINEALAKRLSLSPGDTFVLRVGGADAIPLLSPISNPEEEAVSLTLDVERVVGNAFWGRFGITPIQASPLTVFLNAGWLSERLGRPGRANLLLFGSAEGSALSGEDILSAISRNWTLEDVGWTLRTVADGSEVEVRSERIFLDAAEEKALLVAAPGAHGLLGYFVNALSVGNRAAPYSFVAAPGAPLVPETMDEGEVLVNRWLAEDLSAGVGDGLTMRYFVLAPGGGLQERERTFRIRGIVDAAFSHRELAPPFPGLFDAGSCSDWHPGIPIDLERIRPQDEAYWEAHGPSPKAFVTLAAAREMWANRFGALTAVRLPASRDGAIGPGPPAGYTPAAFGFLPWNAREEGLRASRDSVDFGQLFIGLSFFLILSGLILTGLLFGFSAEVRSDEAWTLRAVGFTGRRVKLLFLCEGAILAAVGSVAGAAAGAVYNHLVLAALAGGWQGAVGAAFLEPAAGVGSLCTGIAGGMGAGLLAVLLGLRRLSKTLAPARPPTPGRISRVSMLKAVLSAACLPAAAVLLLWAGPGRRGGGAGFFFLAGALLLASALLLLDWLLRRVPKSAPPKSSPASMALRGLAVRPGRSVSTVLVMACGVFLVVTVGLNRRDLQADTRRTSSGTGGYALYGETTLPVAEDLNSREGRKALNLTDSLPDSVRFLELPAKDGSDASCLNLHRVRRPRLLGVDPKVLEERGAFTFVSHIEGRDPGWDLLDIDPAADEIPGVADQTVIVWGLGKKVGDTLDYVDERGRPFRIRLVGGIGNSVFQGSILISRRAFEERFPSFGGTRVFLVDASRGSVGRVRDALHWALEDYGPEILSAPDRLAAFNAVENTYLSIFLALGGLGLALGALGLGILLLRNVQERRGELALLRAVGFGRGRIRGMLFLEHGVLLGAGLVLGTAAGAAATLPSLLSPDASAPWGEAGVVLGLIAASGALWIWAAAAWALRGDPLQGLRHE